MRSRQRKALDGLYGFIESSYRACIYRKKAKVRLKKLHGGFDCRKEYRDAVVPYWRTYGVRPGIIWYKLFSYGTGKVDPRYIPDDIWFGHIVPYYSNQNFRRLGEDKCLHGIIFPDIKRPHTVIAQIAGVYYDGEYNIITENEAAKRCAEHERFLIKPSVDSGEGVRIKFYDRENVTAEYMLSEFRSFGCNFIAQEVITQHEVLAALNPSSLNTLRIISFLFENEVHILSSIIRIGGSGSRVDNVGAGGYACPVDEDGRLGRFAINRSSEMCEMNETGIRFNSVVIPSYRNAVETVKKMHVRLPHFKIIGWDIGIDINGEPVMIEFNTAPGQNQYSCGPTFGALTEKVLEDVFVTKKLKRSGN